MADTAAGAAHCEGRTDDQRIPDFRREAKCLEKGVIINCTHDTVLRFLPPLNVTSAEIDKAVAVMDEVFQTIEA